MISKKSTMKKTQREKGYSIYLNQEYKSKEIAEILEFISNKHESLELYYRLKNNLKDKNILEIYYSDNSNEIFKIIKDLFYDSKIYPIKNKFLLKSMLSNTPLVKCIKKK